MSKTEKYLNADPALSKNASACKLGLQTLDNTSLPRLLSCLYGEKTFGFCWGRAGGKRTLIQFQVLSMSSLQTRLVDLG